LASAGISFLLALENSSTEFIPIVVDTQLPKYPIAIESCLLKLRKADGF